MSPEELSILDYDALERVLEVNTLRLRPMGVRIFVENPADSANWSKIRFFKNDTSLQSVLIREFFEARRRDGVVTRLDVRDGADRRDESDGMSLRSVGSRIVHGIHHRTETNTTAGSTATTNTWFGLLRRRSTTRNKGKRRDVGTDMEEDDEMRLESQPEPKKVRFGSTVFTDWAARLSTTRR